jgi:hypothetical protein
MIARETLKALDDQALIALHQAIEQQLHDAVVTACFTGGGAPQMARIFGLQEAMVDVVLVMRARMDANPEFAAMLAEVQARWTAEIETQRQASAAQIDTSTAPDADFHFAPASTSGPPFVN